VEVRFVVAQAVDDVQASRSLVLMTWGCCHVNWIAAENASAT
jgi:hypothetical protein